MIKKEPIQYYLFNETTVDEDITMKHREILHENVVNTPGGKLWTLTFKQVLQSFGVRNWNGRIYDAPVVMKALDSNPLIQTDIKNDTWLGEYGHPIIEKGMNELARQMTLFPPNACWKISKYWQEGNLLMGECTTLAGGYGDIVRDRILTNYPAMASSRAIGGVDSRGVVRPGYTPITFDCVIRPSHKQAYMDMGTVNQNMFPIKTPQMNTMSESAVAYDFTSDPAFADFLISESTNRQTVDMLCNTFRVDYDSMTINENSVTFSFIDEGCVNKVVIPLRQMVNMEYYNLFK